MGDLNKVSITTKFEKFIDKRYIFYISENPWPIIFFCYSGGCHGFPGGFVIWRTWGGTIFKNLLLPFFGGSMES